MHDREGYEYVLCIPRISVLDLSEFGHDKMLEGLVMLKENFLIDVLSLIFLVFHNATSSTSGI